MSPRSTLRAGLARTHISPPPRSYLIGYGDRLRGSSGVRDELTATALVLDDDATRVALLCVDMLCLHEDVVARVRERVAAGTGVAPEALLIACSHTHAGPIAWAGPRSAPWRRRLVDRLVAKLAAAVTQASQTLAPASLAVGRGQTRVAVSRRERRLDGRVVLGVSPEGFVDRGLDVVQLRDPDGAPRATLVGLACHPAVLSPRNRRVSAEWPGVMRAEVEAATGATCLFLQGATGDLNPDHVWGDDDEIAMERIGRSVADAVAATLEAGLEPVASVPLAAGRAEVPLAIDLRRGDDGRVESYAETGARRLRGGGRLPVPRFAVEALLRYAYPWRPRQRPGPDGRPELPMEVQALRVGDLALVSHAAETFSAIGHAIKQRAAAPHTLFVGYANGCVGYLATAEAHAEGGYEVEEAPLAYRISGRFDPGSAEQATRRSLELVAELFG